MASSFAPPKLADFLLTEKLGSGTYATVYKAYRKVRRTADMYQAFLHRAIHSCFVKYSIVLCFLLLHCYNLWKLVFFVCLFV